MEPFEIWAENKDLGDHAGIINETSKMARYSVEVNYRTTFKEAVDAFAKLSLGYASAALKNCGYHVKTLFTAEPYRVLVSTRNWDDGEWVGMVVFNHKENCFVVGEGSYNKDKKTVSIHKSKKCDAKSAAEIVKELRNLMEKLKRENPVRSGTLQPAQLKRGPKPSMLTKLNKLSGPWKPRH